MSCGNVSDLPPSVQTPAPKESVQDDAVWPETLFPQSLPDFCRNNRDVDFVSWHIGYIHYGGIYSLYSFISDDTIISQVTCMHCLIWESEGPPHRETCLHIRAIFLEHPTLRIKEISIKADYVKVEPFSYTSKVPCCLHRSIPTCSRYLTLGAAPFRSKCTILCGPVAVLSAACMTFGSTTSSFIWSLRLSVCNSALTGASWTSAKFCLGALCLAQKLPPCTIWWFLRYSSWLEL